MYCKQFDYRLKEWLESYSVTLHWLPSLFNSDDINNMNDKRKRTWNSEQETRRRPEFNSSFCLSVLRRLVFNCSDFVVIFSVFFPCVRIRLVSTEEQALRESVTVNGG